MKLPKSLRIYIRRQKARIRREVLEIKKQEEEIKKLYEKILKSLPSKINNNKKYANDHSRNL
jgi:hypothetical protein